jgi:hypothetical protein
MHDHQPILQGRKALVVGIGNDSSIAYGCAKAFREVGAEDISGCILLNRRGPFHSRSFRCLRASSADS